MKGSERSIQSAAKFLILVGWLGIAHTAAEAADWPQYRGRNRDGRSSEQGLIVPWPAGGPRELWRVPLGSGYSGIAVAGDLAFTQFGAQGREWAAAFDTNSGREIWRVEMDSNREDSQGDGPRSTPTIDGERIFVLGARGVLLAMNSSSGEVVWRRDLPAEFGARVPQWGVATSPLVEQSKLIVDVGGRSNGIVAFDKENGEVLWRSAGHEAAYSSPIAATIEGMRQLILFTAQGLVGHSASDGSLLWEFPWRTAYDVNAATPVLVPRNAVFISSGYDTGAALIRIEAQDGTLQPYQVWRSRVMKNHFNSSVLVGDFLYGFDESILKCIEARSGEEMWRARGNFGKGSLLYADGHLIVLGGSGTLGLVEATATGFVSRGEVRLFRGRSWTMPSLADGVLYVRSFEELMALRVGQESDRMAQKK